MKIFHYTEVEPKSIEGESAANVKARVVIGRADGASNFCMRVFEMGAGGSSEFHSHDWEHEVFCHSGRGEMYCQDKWVEVGPGSVIFVPAGETHQLKNTGQEPLVFVCLIPAGAPEI